MKKLSLLILVCVTILLTCLSCSHDPKSKDLTYEFTIQGVATLERGESIDVDLHFSNTDILEKRNIGNRIARAIYENQSRFNSLNPLIKKQIANRLHWKSYDITIRGYVRENLTGTTINI
ncbi:hypothetical protein EZS27_027359, partial [termite gut metagenome]